MNPYTTRTQARIQPHDIANAVFTEPWMAAAVTALERFRAYQAEAEIEWRLQQHGVAPDSVASRVALVQQAIGASLVRAGERLASTSARGRLSGTAPVNGMLRTAD
jgi:hypothetical protein